MPNRQMTALTSLFLSVAFSVPAVAQSPTSQVAKSWEKAQVYVGGASRAGGTSKVSVSDPTGVVIFLHGCAGIDPEARNWAALISGQKFVVILPDSLVRTDRMKSCDPAKRQYGLFPPVHGMRLEEVMFAAEQVRKQPWFDGKNLFVMGYSQGGLAAVRIKAEGFAGIISTSWSCTYKNYADFNGVFVPPTTPVLTISHATDVIYQNLDAAKGSCLDKIRDRKNARHVTVPGAGHGTYHDASARKAVLDFLKANTRGS